MDPISAIGLTATLFTLIGVAGKITKNLDNLVEKWDDAPTLLIALRTQIYAFVTSLTELHRWMGTEFKAVDENDSVFLDNLSVSIEGCSLLLGALNEKLASVVRTDNPLSKRDRARFIWSESGIKDLTDYLTCQAAPLGILLQCRTLVQQQRDKILNSKQNKAQMAQMIEQTKEMRRISTLNAPNPPSDSNTLEHLLYRSQDPQPIEVAVDSKIYFKEMVSQLETASGGNLDTTSDGISETFSNAPTLRIDVEQEPLSIDFRKLSMSKKQNRQEPIEAYNKLQRRLIEEFRKNPITKKGHIQGVEPDDVLSESNGGSQLADSPTPEKFRILVMGQAGVGKSTLCGKVLGISEEASGVKHRGIGTPLSKVWDEITFPTQNKNIILHDSGGIEAGSDAAAAEINKFIQYRTKQIELKDQLHCIWYCISCASERAIQDAEKKFFRTMSAGPVPVILVFTRYDRLIRDHQSNLEDEDVERHKAIVMAKKNAFEDYQTNFKDEALKLVPSNANISLCRVGFPPKKPDLAAEDSENPLGTNALIEETLKHLQGDRLRLIWMVAQRHRADYLLEASIERCISYFWDVQTYGKIPVPVLSLYMIGKGYVGIIETLTNIWDINVSQADLWSRGCLNASLGVSDTMLVMKSIGLSYAMFGPLTATITAKITLKVITGCCIMFEQFYWIKNKFSATGKTLTLDEIEEETSRFANSPQRTFVNEVIEDSIKLKNCYSRRTAKETVERAMKVAKQVDTALPGTAYARRSTGLSTTSA